ncbi:MAG: ester cyclase [Steroidobacteraceae bacterium]
MSERNKRIAIDFYLMAFNQGKPEEAADKHMGADYRQHNPEVADGRTAFIEFVKSFRRRFPQFQIEIKRALADGDLVALHCLATTSPLDRGVALVDIFRIVDDKVVEHWDVIQRIPENSLNANTMF